MRVKKVNRYYCDFCKKSGCSSGHLKRHERGCTLNPKRECGMCREAGESQKPMEKLLSVFPLNLDVPVNEFGGFYVDDATKKQLDKVLEDLREQTENCPHCIFAAIRQSKIRPFLFQFDFKKENRDRWDEINKSRESFHDYI